MRSVYEGVFLACCISFFAAPSHALLLGFDSPPFISGSRLETSYVEQGVSLTGFFGHGGTLNSGRASNSSRGLIELPGRGFIRVETVSGDPFSLGSIDLSEYSTLFANQPASVSFTGYLFGGGTVSTTFITDGVIDSIGGVDDFETFRFGTEFSNLLYLETNSFGYALDNLELNVVSLPSSLSLLALCVGALVWNGAPKSRKLRQS